MTGQRFERQMSLFGAGGQEKIRAAHGVVIGAGGLGTQVVQQLALLGVGRLTVMDSEELAESNRNRYVTARADDPVPGTLKVNIAERLIKSIDPAIQVSKIPDSFVSESGFAAIVDADYVFGCVDSEGARLVLNELCAAYARPYWDLASDVVAGDPVVYGGRISVNTWAGEGCLMCRGLIDVAEAQTDLAGPAAKRDRDAIYGVQASSLGRSGPSVVTINGVVASLATTEFMVAVTGLRSPKPLQMYYGHTGRLTTPTDTPVTDCLYCSGIRGTGNTADVQRYVRANIGAYLR